MKTSTRVPKRFVVVDTETAPTPGRESNLGEYHMFQLGYMEYWEQGSDGEWTVCERELTNTNQFYEELSKLPRGRDTIYIFAHNAGFDLRVLGLFKRLTGPEWSLLPFEGADRKPGSSQPLLVLENPPTLVKFFREDNQVFMFSDTVQLFFNSIAGLGRSIGLEKLEDPGGKATYKERMVYCRRDVEILREYLFKYFAYIMDKDLGTFRPTLAGQTYGAFFSRFCPIKVEPHSDIRAWRLERKAYYGGRLDCYFIGSVQGPVHQYDANSLYPAVMHDNLYPIRLLTYKESSAGTINKHTFAPDRSIATVEIRSGETAWPVRARGGTYFAKGRFKTTLAGPELRRALECGVVKKVYRVATYQMGDIFKEFVLFFWSEKHKYEKMGMPAEKEIAKRMLVSLYGKFGQLSPDWQEDDISDEGLGVNQWEHFDADTGKTIKCRSFAGLTQSQGDPGMHAPAFVAIAAFVTAYGRELMYKYREIAGFKNVFYQATDSLFVDEIGKCRLDAAGLLSEKHRGKMKYVNSFDNVTFESVHRYQADDKRVLGAIRKGSKQIGPKSFECTRFESTLGGLNRGHYDGVYIGTVIKNLRTPYQRGVITPSGWVEPFTLDSRTYEAELDIILPEIRTLIPEHSPEQQMFRFETQEE